jgi:hypothetical protein
MQRVSLYIRNHSTRRYEKAKPKTSYPMGTIYVLRYGGKWENAKGLLRASRGNGGGEAQGNRAFHGRC